jgi:predicted SnoaL-like aldol condensation-catalyzing enzyme
MYRIEDGKIAEHWDVVETTGLPDGKISEPF